jgi:hypothetical protein
MTVTTTKDNTKQAVLKLLSSGRITFAEASRLSGESRQLVYHWARAAGISIDGVNAARERHLDFLWTQTLAEVVYWNADVELRKKA